MNIKCRTTFRKRGGRRARSVEAAAAAATAAAALVALASLSACEAGAAAAAAASGGGNCGSCAFVPSSTQGGGPRTPPTCTRRTLSLLPVPSSSEINAPPSPSSLFSASDASGDDQAQANEPPSTGGRQRRRYVRIQPKGKRRYEVQTAVTTFAKILPGTGETVTVDLHSQLHFGDRAYYDYYNDARAFTSKYDRTHYELIVGGDLIDADTKTTAYRRIKPTEDGRNPIMASPADAGTASGYGLYCQADVVNYAQDGWVNADLTREEFVEEASRAAVAAGRSKGEDDNPADGKEGNYQTQQQPLWALASTAAIFPGSEFVSALLRPSTPSTPVSSRVTRRLFSNLFLPGDALTAIIRAVLWTTVPAPEVSVMLLDWSSLTPRPTGGISPVALPVLECLLTGNIREARKLVFGQMVVSGQAAADSSGVLIRRRNERALEVLTQSIEGDGCRRNALVYGAMHCRDLHGRLVGMGFRPTKTEWRTAWSVDIPRFGTGRRAGNVGGGGGGGLGLPTEAFAASSSSTGIAIALVVVPLYLAIGGFDWLATVRDVGRAVGDGKVADGAVEAALYLVRHVALYLGLAKFVVEWDGANLFGGDGPR